MGIYLSFSVLRVGSDGEVVLESVRSPLYSVRDSVVCDLFSPHENRRFASALDGLELPWYTHTTMAACLAERRNPRRADCFEPDELLHDLLTLRDRLETMRDRLPRLYSLRKSTKLDEALSSARFFYDGKAYHAGCGWDSCNATWRADRGSTRATIEHMLTEPPDAEIDLRNKIAFACRDAVGPRGEGAAAEDYVEGPPITLYISSSTASEVFRPYLDEMIAFARDANAGGYVVFTSRS
jgi:hypothetical protein